MSVIAVKRYEDRIEIAADSILMGNQYNETERIKFSKIFQINNIVMACAGSAQDCLFLRAYCKDHKPPSADTDGVFTFLLNYLKYATERFDGYEMEVDGIMIYEGHIFSFSDLETFEVADYYAGGVGRNFALTTLHLGFDPIKAVEVACEMLTTCVLPVVYFTVNL